MAKEIRIETLQCFCKRTIKDKGRPDIKGFSCKCTGFDNKGFEKIIRVSNYVVVNKR